MKRRKFLQWIGLGATSTVAGCYVPKAAAVPEPLPKPEDPPPPPEEDDCGDIAGIVKLDDGYTMIVTDYKGTKYEYKLSRKWDITSPIVDSERRI